MFNVGPLLRTALVAVAVVLSGILYPISTARSQTGININATDAMKSDDADQWLKDTVSGIRSKVRRESGVPTPLVGAFIGQPFTKFFNERTGDRSSQMGVGCGWAAGVVAGGVVADFETLLASPGGAAVMKVKGVIDLGSSIYDAGSTIATAGGSTVAKKLGNAAIDAAKDKLTDAAKDMGKDVAKGTAGDLIKGEKPDISSKIGEAVQGKVDDAKEFVEGLKDYFKDGPKVFAFSESKDACKVATLWIWDEHELNVYIRGTCDCKSPDARKLPQGPSAELSSFYFHLRAKTIVNANASSSSILRFTLGDVLWAEPPQYKCGCEKPKTATGGGYVVPPVPAVCPKCQEYAKDIEALNQEITSQRTKSDLANAAARQAAMGGNDEEAKKFRDKKNEIDALIEKLETDLAAKKKLKDDCEKQPCKEPKTGSMVFPRYERGNYAVSYTVPFATESTYWCTYGDGSTVYAPVTFVDDGGDVITPDGPTVVAYGGPPPRNGSSGPGPTPSPDPQAGTPPPSDGTTPQGPVPTGEPTTNAGTPPTKEPETPPTAPTAATSPPATTDTPPPTTTDSPPSTTTDTPPTEEITIIFKVKELVLEGGSTGTELQNQVVKLFTTDTPDLPNNGQTKTAQDKNFDQKPTQCTTDAKGECKTSVPASERNKYNLPAVTAGGKPIMHYRVDVDTKKNGGGVAEKTGSGEINLSNLPPSVSLQTHEFKIGDRTFVRVSIIVPYGTAEDYQEYLHRIFGPTYTEDYCRDKEPGPPLGPQKGPYSRANDDAVPAAAVHFGSLSVRAGARR